MSFEPTPFNVYKESLKKIADKTSDYKDEVIVSLYKQFTAEVERCWELKKELKAQSQSHDKRAADQHSYIEILEARIERLDPEPLENLSESELYVRGLLSDVGHFSSPPVH